MLFKASVFYAKKTAKNDKKVGNQGLKFCKFKCKIKSTATFRGVFMECTNRVNFINFLRGVNQAHDFDYMIEPVVEELKVAKEFGVPVTFLLQYDALIDDGFIKILKPEDTKTVEVGAWFEIPKQLVEAAGLKWRGREGFTWDWYNEVGFLVGYTQEERVLLIDEYFKKFKEIFGYYPVVVGSWHIDAFSMNYMAEKYGVIGSCMCREQIGTDGYTMWGGHRSLYYPNKNNMYAPAKDKKNQINLVAFKMLGECPIYCYDHPYLATIGGAPKALSQVVTMEPASKIHGGNEGYIKNYYNNTLNPLNSQFVYTQIGQENGFGWDLYGVSKGSPIQVGEAKRLMDEGKMVVEKFSETAKWFRDKYDTTPSSVYAAEEDYYESGRKSYWCYNKDLRANIYVQNKIFWIRDIYLYDDEYKERYLNNPCVTHSAVLDNLPAVDGYVWSNEFTRAGLYPVVEKNGQKRAVQFKNTEIKNEEGVLKFKAITEYGDIEITVADKITLKAPEGVMWQFRYAMPEKEFVEDGQGYGEGVNDWDNNIVKWDKKAIHYKHNGFKYKFGALKGKISKNSVKGRITFISDKGELILSRI